MTHEFKKYFSKKANMRKITISNDSILSFLDCLFSSLFQFFNVILSILKNTNFQLSEKSNMINVSK